MRRNKKVIIITDQIVFCSKGIQNHRVKHLKVENAIHTLMFNVNLL